jgi:hypothetical protein
MSTEPILLMEFLDGSDSFCHGFESGQIWERVKQGDIIEDQPIHTANAEQIKNIMVSYQCEYVISEIDEHWSLLTMKSAISLIDK